jgi:hypothetical protein
VTDDAGLTRSLTGPPTPPGGERRRALRAEREQAPGAAEQGDPTPPAETPPSAPPNGQPPPGRPSSGRPALVRP